MHTAASPATPYTAAFATVDLDRSTVKGAPRLILQFEGAAILAVSTIAFSAAGGNWVLFALLFLVPDIFMLGYLKDTRFGALVYNVGHSTMLPLLIAGFGHYAGNGLLLQIGLIWLAHVGFDRLIGYGLKYADAFKHTHLGVRR